MTRHKITAPLDRQLLPDAPKPKATLVKDMSIEDYHALGKRKGDPVLSKSMLAKMNCPAKYEFEYLKGNASEDKAVFAVGNAVHTAALEPDTFHDRFYVIPEGTRRDARTAEFKKCIEEAGDRKMILAKSSVSETGFDGIQAMGAALAADKFAVALLDRPGLIEPSIFWTDEETGVKLRARPDFMGDDGLIVNLKTAVSVEPQKFFRDAYDFAYDMSAAMECEAFQQLNVKPAEDYVFLAIEKKPPFIIAAFNSFDPWDRTDPAQLSYVKAGEHRFRKMLSRYVDCTASNHWPGYSQQIAPMAVPGYALKQMENENG